jgi:hypothetical protein
MEAETWSEVAAAIFLAPIALYCLIILTIVAGDLVTSLRRPQYREGILVRATAALLAAALYLLVLGPPFLGVTALLDKLTDA